MTRATRDHARRAAEAAQRERGLGPEDDRSLRRLKGKPFLVLQPDIAQQVDVLAKHLEGRLDVPLIHIGGGSVLAAYYGHRASTDIDLWGRWDRAQRVTERAHDNESWRRMFEIPGRTREPSHGDRRLCQVETDIDGVETTLGATWLVRERARRQRVQGTRIAVLHTDEILGGKILERWQLRDHPIPIRDLYDVFVACHREPAQVQKVLQLLRGDPPRRQRVLDKLMRTPADVHLSDEKPLREEIYDLELEGIASKLVPAVEQTNVRLIPSIRSLGGDPGAGLEAGARRQRGSRIRR